MPAPLRDQTHEPAPTGRRVVVASAITALLTLVGVGILISVTITSPGPQRIPMIVAALLIPAALAVYWSCARIVAYRLSGGMLVVERRLLSRRFPLDQVASSEIASDVMRGAWKFYGNDGLGAVAGSYRSRRWGRFRAYLSDPSRAVVLHLRDGRALIISPAHPEVFERDLRARLA